MSDPIRYSPGSMMGRIPNAELSAIALAKQKLTGPTVHVPLPRRVLPWTAPQSCRYDLDTRHARTVATRLARQAK
jgi:hypothetical protein